MTLRTTIAGLVPGTEYAFRFRSYNGDGFSDWSPVFNFTTTADTVAPAPVTNLTWVVTGGTFVGNWVQPSLNEDGTMCQDFRDFQVTISDGDPNTAKVYYQTAASFSFSLDANQQAFGVIQPTLTITVQGRDYTGNLADPVTLTATDPLPPIPSNPVVSVYLGQLVVQWDGKSAAGNGMPYNYDHTEVHVSKTSNFTPSDATRVDNMFGPAKIIVSNLDYGSTYYVRLLTVNTLGRKSDPSAQASGVPVRISGLDIQNGAISVDQINFVDQIGGPKAFYQTTKPTTGMKKGDIWYDTSATGKYQPSVYDGTDWNIDNNIGVIAGTKILAGTVTADQIGTNKIITSSANIGTAVIDDSNIGNLNAGKITAGVLQSAMTVNIDGTTRPAWSMDTAGMATFNSANIYGTITVGSTGNTTANNGKISLQSANYLTGSAGWAIKGDGSVEFNNGVFRGTLAAGVSISSPVISGGTISGTTISAGTTLTSPIINGGTITGGTFQTSAGSYPRLTFDTTGLYAYNSGGTQTFSVSATTGNVVATGVFRSAVAGSRVEINSSFTRPGAPGWSTNSTGYAGLRLFASNDNYFGEVGVGDEVNFYTIQMISPGAGSNNGSFLRLRGSGTTGAYDSAQLYSSTTTTVNAQGVVTVQSVASSVSISAATSIGIAATSGATLSGQTTTVSANGNVTISGSQININATPTVFNTNAGQLAVSSAAGSAFLVFQGGTGGVVALKVATWSDGYGTGLSVLNSSDSAYYTIRAGAFYVPSDISIKSNVTPVATSMLADVVNTNVYEYDVDASHDMPDGNGKTKKTRQSGRRRGILAGDAPPRVKVPGNKSSDHPLESLDGVDLYAMAATAWGAIKELHDTIEQLKQDINILKGKNNG